MNKTLLLGAGILGVLGTVVYLARADLAEWLMARGLQSALGSDATSSLPDGLHVALCGAGGPLPDLRRSGPCVAVVAGSRLFVVDAGSGGARTLARMRYPLGRIEAVLLTHYHSDHIDGLGELAMLRWVQGGQRRPLPVFGPDAGGQRLARVVEGFDSAYAADATYRNAHHGDDVAPLAGHGMSPRAFTLPAPGALAHVYQAEGLSIEALAVDHAPVNPAVGYLFSYRGRTLLISGDTAASANVEGFAEGVDLLVHEALAPQLVALMTRAARDNGNLAMARITTDIVDYHASPMEVARIASQAGVGHLLFYHIVPPLLVPGSEAAFLRGVDDVFDRHTLGRDGTSFSLPAGSEEVILTRRGL